MRERTLKDLESEYDLQLDNVIVEIKKAKAKIVLLQFPDGLKQYSSVVVDFLKENTKAEFLVWFSSCYGACDTPTGIERIKPSVDLVIQFGHNEMMPRY